MQWTDEAIVLRIGRFREADLWVRLLSKGRGLFTAFAFGGSRSRRRFTGCLDSFNRISVSISPSRDGRFLNMEEATLLSGPDRLRRDWRRQGIAANCVSFTEAMGVPPDDAEGCHTLLRSMLDLLEDGCEPSAAAPVMYRFRLAAEQGYVPDLGACARCGAEMAPGSPARFLVAEGMLCCPSCFRRGEMGLELGQEALDVLRKVKENSPVSWDLGSFSSESHRQASRLVDAFVRYHLGLEWVNGRFRAI